MSSLRTNGGVLIVLVLLILLYSQLPLGTALEFSPDEGFELMKGFLCSKGYVLYQEIWSDQPPVYTMLLKWAFQTAEPSILVARLVAAGFGCLLFSVFYELVRERSGVRPAMFAIFFLIASPVVLLLSIAVMKEVAAFGTALLSVWLLFRWSKNLHWSWLVASGVVMGLAAEIKFSALLVVPAALVEIMCFGAGAREQTQAETTKINRKARHKSNKTITTAKPPAAWRNLIVWVAGLLATVTIVGLAWSRGSFAISWKAHLTGHPIAGLQNREEIRIPLTILLDHGECLLAAAAGALLMLRKRRWRDLAFPMTLLLTATVVHSVHRPWWDYYYLHLAIPMAWLAGIAAAEAIALISGLFSKSRFHLGQAATWKGFVLCGMTALVLTRSLGRLEAGAKDLRDHPKARNNPVVAMMKKYAGGTHWAYATDPIYPFHARLLMPPELAVVTPKRFWSGQITEEEIVTVCRRRQVELLLLDAGSVSPAWGDLSRSGYSIAYQDKDYILYVAKGE